MRQSDLTAKQEGYAQDRASGLDKSAAYRNNYDTSSMATKTVHEAACRLDKNYKVAARVQELREAVTAEYVEQSGWNLEQLVEEAFINRYASRKAKQFGSANGALELISRVTGLLGGKSARRDVKITEVVIHTGDGVEERQIVESTFRQLPAPEEGGG